MRVVDAQHIGLLSKSACQDRHPADVKVKTEDSKAEDSKADFSPESKVDDLTKDAPVKTDLKHPSPNPPVSTNPHPQSDEPATTKNPHLAVDLFPPWDIQSIQDGLGGRYDRDTIVDMLQKCRGDIDRAFAALLGEKKEGVAEKKMAPNSSLNPNLQVSRSSSPFSTGSKRSADDSDDSEAPRPAIRRGRPRKRFMSNLTLGVGISFRDDQNEVVSLNLRVSQYRKSNQHILLTGCQLGESGRRRGRKGTV